VGTPCYMAPEQRRSDTTVDERADIHALGAILAGLVDGPKALILQPRLNQSSRAIAISTCWSSLPMWRASCRALRFVPTPKPSSIGSSAWDADTESRSLWCWPTS